MAYYISEHSEDLLSDSDMSNKSYQDISSDYLRKFASKDVGWLEEEFDETTFEKYIVLFSTLNDALLFTLNDATAA